jgi:hypothetical protein
MVLGSDFQSIGIENQSLLDNCQTLLMVPYNNEFLILTSSKKNQSIFAFNTDNQSGKETITCTDLKILAPDDFVLNQ